MRSHSEDKKQNIKTSARSLQRNSQQRISLVIKMLEIYVLVGADSFCFCEVARFSMEVSRKGRRCAREFFESAPEEFFITEENNYLRNKAMQINLFSVSDFSSASFSFSKQIREQKAGENRGYFIVSNRGSTRAASDTLRSCEASKI